jgi:hypothetical protein
MMQELLTGRIRLVTKTSTIPDRIDSGQIETQA